VEKYGFDNVRGGSYSSIKLTDDQLSSLLQQIVTANDLCSKCLRPGHFIKDCYATTDVNGDKLDDSDVYNLNDKTAKKNKKSHNLKVVEQYNCKYCLKEFDTQKGAQYHENIYCQIKKNTNTNTYTQIEYSSNNYETVKRTYTNNDGNITMSTTYNPKKLEKGNTCYRCGRPGHMSSSCYATKHVKGYVLK